jgi:glyoxylase-like metal-dependent hydrolase (beta-lactamase superfamily II)
MSKARRPEIASYFHADTNSVSHLVFDRATRQAAVIDPVLDFNPRTGETATASADRIVTLAKAEGLTLRWILETHIHADHLTAAQYIKRKLGGEICAGARIADAQAYWSEALNLTGEAALEPGVFDRLFQDGETFAIGALTVRVMDTPGHTACDVTYIVGDAAFIGDTLFMPDYGTARADFPGGGARALYQSIRKILDLPDDTRLFLCHDYLSRTRSRHQWESTVAAQKHNVLIDGRSEDEFAGARAGADAALPLPDLFYAALQVNLRAGLAPPPEANGVSYLKLPLS